MANKPDARCEEVVSVEDELPGKREQYTFDRVKFIDAGIGIFRLLDGRVKTVIDAAIAEPTQRKAAKDLANQAIWRTWYEFLQERVPQIDETPSEVDRLAQYLLTDFPYEIGKGAPQHGESAVDVALRLLESLEKK